MKKIIVGFLCMLLLCSCAKQETTENTSSYAPVKAQNEIKENKTNGVWISYIELDNWLKSGEFSKKINDAAKNCKSLNVTDVFVHAVAFCDSFYKSAVYPTRPSVKASGIEDPFGAAVNAFSAQNIRVHAWFNPYRVKKGDCEFSLLPQESPVYKWHFDNDSENDINICTANGIYLNPASAECQRLLINGIKEVIENYNVAGVHFDDYFYPTTDISFDAASYSIYEKQAQNPMPLDDFRRENVNNLVLGVKTALDAQDKNLIFSISPAASIEKNYKNLYADVNFWCENSLIDMIIPQLYFGYEYPNEQFRFPALVEKWKSVTDNTDVSLCIGLAPYKINTTQAPDNTEWANNPDIVVNETKDCLADSDICGFVYFSYSDLFSDEAAKKTAREKITEILK